MTSTPPTIAVDSYLETLASYVPKRVVDQLLANPSPMQAPRYDDCPAAVLFADISGFTPLTEALVQGELDGLETLSNILNTYFGGIIDLILAQGGDILKFAGDALLAAWPLTGDTQDLGQATHRAAQCALAIQDYSHTYAQSSQVGLRLRISIGAGNLGMSHVGGRLQRWEYTLSGDALTQMQQASQAAEPGWVILSRSAWSRVAAQAQGESLADQQWRLLKIEPCPHAAAAAVALPSTLEAGLRHYIPGGILGRLAAGHSEWLAEYRQVTLLFIKLPHLNPSVDLQQLQTFMQDAQAALYHYEGSVNKISVDNKGTALMAAFGLPPFAHENDPERALKAALQLQSQMQALEWSCCIGISSGSVFCGTIGNARRREYTIIGDVVNRAARLMEVASQKILCDRTTYTATRTKLAFRTLPATLLKGIDQRVDVFQPLGLLQLHLVPAATLIGAERERQHLIQAAEHLLAHQEGQVAVIEGEAGLGKSQLLANFLQWATARDLTVVLGAAEAVEQFTPYYAWRQILHQLLGLQGIRDGHRSGIDQRMAENQHLLQTWLHAAPDLAKLAPLLNLALDLELPETDLTQQIRGRVRADNIQRLLVYLLERSVQHPTLVILEDAHWLDSASWNLLLTLQRQSLPLLLILATRPLSQPSPAYAQLCAAPTTHVLQMPILSAAETQPFLAQQLGIETVTEPVATFVYERAEGHPLFSEEIAYTLRDQGYLNIKDGTCRFATQMRPFDELGLPNTIKGLMTSRFDQLLPTQQLLLKVASVIGRSFLYSLLHEIYPLPEDKASLLGHLQGLHQAALVLLETSEPQLIYMFRHIMIQEVAYNQMLFAQRREFHRAIAQWYEQHYIGQASVYGVLAYHWSRAAQPEPALNYLLKAGEQMLQNGSCQEAVEFLTQALALAPSVPGHSPLAYARWHRQLGDAYLGLGQMKDCEVQFRAALQRLRSHIPQTIPTFWLAFAGQLIQQLWHCVRRPQPGRSAASTIHQDRLERTRAYVRLGEVCYYTHRRTLATYASIAGLNLAETVGPSPELARIYANTCFAMGLQGLHILARRYGNLAESTIAQLPHSWPCIGWTSLVIGTYNLGSGRWPAAQFRLERGIQAYTEINAAHHLAETHAALARVYHCQGQFQTAVENWRMAFHHGEQHRDCQAQTWGLLGEAEEQLALNQMETAHQLINNARQWLVDRDDLITDQIRFHGLSALIACETGDLNQAEHHAGIAMRYIQQSPPIAAYVYESYSGVVQVYYQLWQAAEQHTSYERLLRQACAVMDAYAKAFPMAQPRALHWRASVAFAQGRRRRAQRLWRRAIQLAQTLKMPYEEARIQQALFPRDSRAPLHYV